MALMQTIAEVTQLKREIDDQIALIDAYKKANRDNMALVRAELRGSRRSFDRIMLDSLNRSDAALDKALVELQRASEALSRVALI